MNLLCVLCTPQSDVSNVMCVCAQVLLTCHMLHECWSCAPCYPTACQGSQRCIGTQVKELNLEEGGAFTVSSADEILSAL